MTTASSPHAGLVAAIEDMARAQRETGAWLARTLECGRGGLSVIRVLDRGPRQVSELAQHLRVDVSVASRQVAALAEAGLVDRDVPATDRRARMVALTESGRALAVRSSAASVELAAAVFADWDPAAVEAAAEQFRRVADAVSRHHGLPGARSATATPTATTAAPPAPPAPPARTADTAHAAPEPLEREIA
ncbi:MarR family winged helix-turn-helix transcriptional regulator [Cellulomonas aerilata]|nr:MarR family transcriptional regulator [Cellulomonas aerilata]